MKSLLHMLIISPFQPSGAHCGILTNPFENLGLIKKILKFGGTLYLMMTRKLNCVIEANAILGFQSIVSSTNWIFEFDDDPFVSFPIEYFFSSMDFFFSNSCTAEEASDGQGIRKPRSGFWKKPLRIGSKDEDTNIFFSTQQIIPGTGKSNFGYSILSLEVIITKFLSPLFSRIGRKLFTSKEMIEEARWLKL